MEATENPLVLTRSEWHSEQLAASNGRTERSASAAYETRQSAPQEHEQPDSHHYVNNFAPRGACFQAGTPLACWQTTPGHRRHR